MTSKWTAVFAITMLSWVGMTAPNARADDKAACAAAAERGQALRSKGRLVETRAQFIACARRECPPLIQEDCIRWLNEIERQLPTVVVRAVDSRGRDVVGVRVEVDGQLLADRLDGRAIPLDPGPRRLRVQARGGRIVEQMLVVAEGETARVIVVAFDAPMTADGLLDLPAPTPTPTPAEPSDTHTASAPARGVPSSAWVGGGVALGGLLAFSGFELWGQSEYRALRDGCGRTVSCSESDVSPARTKFVVAGVSLCVAAVATAVTAIILATQLGEPRTQARARGALHF